MTSTSSFSFHTEIQNGSEASASTPTVEGSKASAANAVKADPYRFNFGKHKGKLLDETPPDYIRWVIREDIAAG